MSGIKRWRDSGHLERAVETAGGQDAFDAGVGEMLDRAGGWRPAELRKGRDQLTFAEPVAPCIPERYRSGMTTQIAVRLSDDLVAFVDGQVRDGSAASRAVVVARALERERRRAAAERDAAIYAVGAEADDLDDLAAWAETQPMDID